MKRALITDGIDDSLLKGLEALGYVCDYRPNITLDEVREIIPPYEGMIINSKILVDRDMLDRATNLRFVGRLGSGMEIVDQVYAREKGVAVLSAPEGNRNAVAEQALGMLLMLANNLARADREVRQKVWERERNRGFEIMGQTVGIIGFGHTGRAFAGKLSGLGVRVQAYDKYLHYYAEDLPHVTETDLETVLTQSDIISFHLPLNDSTYHFADRAFFERCRPGVVIINTSRGTVIDTPALIEALDSGQVRGACLDVFENEKPHTFSDEEHAMYDQLYRFEQVVLSPHVAGWTVESKRRLAAILLDKIQEVLSAS